MVSVTVRAESRTTRKLLDSPAKRDHSKNNISINTIHVMLYPRASRTL